MKLIASILLLNTVILTCRAQDNSTFESTIEIGLFSFYTGIVDVDPGPNWKGYYLPRNDKTGFRITSTNGVCLSEVIHLGIGLGYARYDKISGLLAFGDIRIDVMKTKLAPYVYLNPGYSHFWNQYEGGRSTGTFEGGLGLKYSISDIGSMNLSIGLLAMQQNSYVSWKFGYTF